ncbi:stage II sporulation protein R [uncultured Oscillibacter sp.]|uniref:stage II sporulation protein R n=1 Tax=uncultured Oscillibacter sp. TaxID=876091 RepID=UPI0025ECEA60|nr:stage II sporulation protein R [uncultured Oscillibacter sp.]
MVCTTKRRSRRTRRVLELALGLGLAAALIWGNVSLHRQQALADRVVRLHILANSDSEEDQALKLQVRDRVLDRAAEILTESADRAAAEHALRAALPELESLAADEIALRGYDYPVTAELADTAFPTREYDGFALPAGRYLALRLVIGAGEGHNWWCVVFPPLCTAVSSDLAQTAMAAGLTEDDVQLITESESGYVLKFKSIELWESLRARLAPEE